MPVRPTAHVFKLLESDSYRTFTSLREVNRQLVAANDALLQLNGELLAENEDLQRENLALHIRLTRVMERSRDRCES